ncbi:MAG: A/G-specific adenine glycosylase [Desulfomicrobium sp.]|nr:A/G-specific adenine glycosylase [Pseudomonadota bacterium]MBV1713544.1 A/G-specific adenine glycosylase [Desulfomicrobium sp.]MBU4572080.1 A/G-specific adenine glycosylase [Pseudomonadota bacterium]MBU4594058.1 A/G-specific adenine glycosylase [Pseudomonadota bacterium]MBV1720991.1 A/G-specific adenine glycosylase [Desulfomicrobium sp.]
MPSPTGRDDPSCTHIAGVLLDWFSRHKRDLPWRRTYAPYHVWISEVMLQQTQMERGVEYFKRWIARFPDVESLAGAREDEILKLWEGLGYYSRARNLHKAAQEVVNRHGGTLPSSPEALRALPGIGPYTARAIASIAFGQDVCVVDANVERLISRLYDIGLPVKSRQARDEIERHGADLLPEGRARDFNQALMEFGSLVCSPRNPACAECPLADCCLARKNGVQEQRPVIVKAPSPIYISMATGVLVNDGRILTQKRRADDVWGNLWEFPGGVVENGETPDQAVVREYLEETGLIVNHPVPIATFKHSYTRYRVTLHAFSVTLLSSPEELALQAAQEHRWACWSEITKLAFPAGHRKLVHHLLNDPEFRAKVHP